MPTTRRAALVATLAAFHATPEIAFAQAYPGKPIRVVVPWVAGVPGDVAVRALAERMNEDLKQPLVVDNKTGATGTVAIPEVLRQAADGYTLYNINSASLIGPLLYPSADIDFFRDFSPVGAIATSASILVTSPSLPYTKVADIVAAAKEKPDVLTYASAGSGSPPHMNAEQFKHEMNVRIKHVPYAQVSQLVLDLAAGRVDMAFLGAPLAIPQIKGGRFRGLAINTQKRAPLLPDVPTLAELGINNVDIRGFDGFLVKKGTPAAVIKRLSDSMQRGLTVPSVRETLEKSGLEVLSMPSDDFGRYLLAESQRLQALGRRVGVRVE
jgi:tripartite-type tricarboxylate transporter receptor subunit TctC